MCGGVAGVKEGVPLEGGGLPGVFRGERAVVPAADEIEEEEELGGGEDEGSPGDVGVDGKGGGEEMVGGGVGKAGELGVVAGLAEEAGEVHGEEGGVGGGEGEPEVPAAEILAHDPAGFGRYGR